MKSTPKWGSPKNYQMNRTRSRNLRSNSKKKENIPVRNLVKEIATIESSSPHHSVTNTGKENSSIQSSKGSDGSPSADNSILSESRYNLRSFQKGSTNVSDNKGKLKQKEDISKGFLTPSRAQSRNLIPLNKSIYRTPRIQSAIKNVPIGDFRKQISSQQKEIWKKEITDILNKTWKTSYLSTSVAFKYEKKNLKKSYESVLRSRILDVFPAYEVTVEISATTILNQNPKEDDGVFFIVTTFQPGEGDEVDKEPLVYKAFLMKSAKVQSEQLPDTEWYPLLLHRGAEIIHQTFVTWLQSSFGCYVTPKHLPQSCMLWIAGLWSRVVCEKKYHGSNSMGSAIHFHYVVRPPCTEQKFRHSEGTEHILMKVECLASDIRKIWRKLTDLDKDIVETDEIIKFHKLMETYMESVSHLPKSLLQLYLLKTPCMTISGDGRLRLTCGGKFHSVLRHLVEIFHETCHFNNVDFVPSIPEEILPDIEKEMSQ